MKLCSYKFRAHVASAETFNRTFNSGVECYVKGNWQKAHEFLTESNELMKGLQRQLISSPLYRKPVDFNARLKKTQPASRRPSVAENEYEKLATGDGPSQTLLDYMEAREMTAPVDWQGFRPLTAK